MKILQNAVQPWSAPAQSPSARARESVVRDIPDMLTQPVSLDVVRLGRTPIENYAAQGVSQTARLFRYMEVDEEAAVFLGVNSDVVQALGLIDGAVTVYDGYEMFREGRLNNHKQQLLGGVARIAFGAAGSLPGVGGAVGEGLLGIYQTAEGLHQKDHENTVAGITQFGVSVGMGMLSEGIGGWVGPALILGSNMGRAIAYHQLRKRAETAA